MAKAEKFREEITSKIITALETGTAPCQQPWDSTISRGCKRGSLRTANL